MHHADPEADRTPGPKTTQAARVEGLERIATMLAAAPSARTGLVTDIHGQLDGGGYMSEEKLNLAIYRMLRNVLEDPRPAPV